MECYINEVKWFFGVLEKWLEGWEFFIDGGYLIVDIVIFFWVGCFDIGYGGREKVGLDNFFNVMVWKIWCLECLKIVKGMIVCKIL